VGVLGGRGRVRRPFVAARARRGARGLTTVGR
jgi:hypothetical protein